MSAIPQRKDGPGRLPPTFLFPPLTQLSCCFLSFAVDTLEPSSSQGHLMHWSYRKPMPFVSTHVLSWEWESMGGWGKRHIQETNPTLNLELSRHWGLWPPLPLGRVLNSEGHSCKTGYISLVFRHVCIPNVKSFGCNWSLTCVCIYLTFRIFLALDNTVKSFSSQTLA